MGMRKHIPLNVRNFSRNSNRVYCKFIILLLLQRKIRRSARLSQVHQLDNSQVKSEVSISKSRRKSKEPTATRSARSTKTKATTKGKSGEATIMEESSTVQRYSTRSSARQADMSDDEGDILLSSTKPLTGRKPLSESNFREEIGGLFSSTPYVLEKEAPKKSLGYDKFSQEKVTVTTKVTASEGTMMGEADSDDDEVTKATQKKLEKEQSFKAPPTPTVDETPSWMEIGWKEVALATVLTGIGVLGYVCYVTDYCSYC